MKMANVFGFLVAFLGLAAGALAQTPPIPPVPAAVDLVYAAPFTLQQGFRSDWRNDRPIVTGGYLMVLRVNPNLVYPRQVSQPVLYAGVQTAERINVGYTSGLHRRDRAESRGFVSGSDLVRIRPRSPNR